MAIEIIISKDGSHTLFNPELNETYHSHHGALQESLYVFIEKGLDFIIGDKKELTVFEVGFGTGLNALLSLNWALEKKIKINYHTLEPYPIKKEIYEKLNYIELLQREDLKNEFIKMHEVDDSKELSLNDYFIFHRYNSRLEEFNNKLSCDIIFYDAFAPNKQAEMWDLQNFNKSYSLLKNGGVLVSYCASGQFKRNLKEAGFEVETLQGPPGKKEMTRGLLKS